MTQPTEDISRAAYTLSQIPRRRRPAVCAECGKSFMAAGRQEMCSNACRQRRKYRRMRAAQAAAREDARALLSHS